MLKDNNTCSVKVFKRLMITNAFCRKCLSVQNRWLQLI